MRILFTIADANLQGGTEIFAFHLLHELNALGWNCSLLSITPYRGDDPMVLSFCEDEYSHWKKLCANPINKIMGSVRSSAFLCKLITAKADSLGVEWIVNHTYDICTAVPNCGSYKTAQVLHWSIRGYESSLKNIIRKKRLVSRLFSKIAFFSQSSLWHKALPSFNRLVLLTKAAHSEIKEVCPLIRDEQLVTIPDPLMKKEDSKILASLCNKNLVFVGRLSQEKGVMRLLRIWESINKSKPDYTLRIYGTGDALDEMETYVACHHVAGVSFLGFCNNLEDIYTHADLLLLTSDSEGFGMVLIEAMYYGVPCVSFDCPVSPKEIIADAGIVIPCFDEETYADNVVKLLCEPGRMKQLQENAIKRAADFYIDKVVELWKNMVS